MQSTSGSGLHQNAGSSRVRAEVRPEERAEPAVQSTSGSGLHQNAGSSRVRAEVRAKARADPTKERAVVQR